MKLIESVRIFHSKSNIKDGHDIGPGFGIIISPHPKTDRELEQIGDAVRAVLLELERDGGE